MRIRSLIAAGFILAGLPLLAQDAHQSYITYDDSDSVLVQSDGREVDARVNLPVYPGDEVRAARRGRTELRLADGNIVALDRDSIVKFESMLMNYEEGGQQTVIALANGHAILYRGYEGAEPLRLDTPNASFISDRESIYGVETNSRGIDVVTVFEGSVEVRTPKGTTQLRAGERAKIDPTGVYDRRAISNVAASEFERWFLLRAERYANKSSRHLDASIAYAADELDENGRWVYVKDYDKWAWSPYVSTGWKPYNYGYWGWGANGSNWISYEPWGWVPYHYGSWSYVSNHGWIWFPGAVYAPAWVYWAWGPSWVGWVPWGYYSYYGGYYPWLYDAHCDPRVYGRYGFNGHINVSSGDLRAYTVVDRTTLFSNRADRAALSADAVRDRLARDGGRANFTNQPIRANRNDLKDPSTAVDRIIRGRDGSGTGSVGAGSSGDLTQFFQRDPALPQDIRTRVTRGQSSAPAGTTTTTVRGRNTMPGAIGGTTNPATTTQPGRGGIRGGGGTGGTIDRPGSTTGSTTPGTGTTIPRGGGTSTVPRGGGSTTGGSTSPDTNTSDRPTRNRPVDGATPRTQTPDAPSNPAPRGGTDTPTVERPSAGGTTSSSDGSWRGRPARGGSTSGSSGTTGNTTSSPRTTVRGGGDDPVSRPSTSGSTSSSTSTAPRGSSSGDSWRGTGETVRRVIGSIGGARLTPSDSGGSTSSGTRSGSSSTRSGSGSSSTRSGSGSSSTRGSSGSSGSGSVSRPSSGGSSSGSSSSSSGGSSRSSGSSGSSSSSSSPRSGGGGGKVDRGG